MIKIDEIIKERMKGIFHLIKIHTVESRYLEHSLSRITRYLELFAWSLESSRDSTVL